MSIANAYTTKSLWRQRIGYGIADFACNLVWQMITLYIMFFYTDVMQLNPENVGWIFLIARLVDGIADILIGYLIDITNTKWGKVRPYFLWGAIPLSIFAILAYFNPPIEPTAKIIYALITYSGLSISYTLVNTPLAAILPLLTDDPHERTVLATTRIFFAFVGSTIVSLFTMLAVGYFGKGNLSVGFFRTTVVYSGLSFLTLVFTFESVQEQVEPKHIKIGFLQIIRALIRNRPWQLFAINIVFMWGAFFCQQGSLIYYVTYNLRRPELVSLIAGLSTFVPLFGSFFAPLMTKSISKRNVFLISSGVHLLGILIVFIAKNNIIILVGGTIVSALGFGLRHAVYFSMQADPVDYTEWKTGLRISGIISSLNGFLGKISMAISGFISASILSRGNYVPGGAQSSTALQSIQFLYLAIPVALVFVSMIIMYFYNLDTIYPQIRAEIDIRNTVKKIT